MNKYCRNQKVIHWLEDNVNNFSVIKNQNDSQNGETAEKNDVTFGSELLFNEQQCNHYNRSLPVQIKSKRKVYKCCSKSMTMTKQKSRPLPRLFDDVISVRQPKHKQSDSLINLYRFIDNIDMVNTTNRLGNMKKRSSDIFETDNVLRFLSFGKDASNLEPPDSLSARSSKILSNVSSDLDWDKNKNIFIKQRPFCTGQNSNNLPITSRKGKGIIHEKPIVCLKNEDNFEVIMPKQREKYLRPYRLECKLNNNSVYKVKSLKEAKEVYSKYKKINNVKVNSEKQFDEEITENVTNASKHKIINVGNEVNDGALQVTNRSLKRLETKSKIINEQLDICNDSVKRDYIIKEFGVNVSQSKIGSRGNSVINNTYKSNNKYQKLKIFNYTDYLRDNKVTNKVKTNSCKLFKTNTNKKTMTVIYKSCLLQSPGWSKLINKMKELNVYKLNN